MVPKQRMERLYNFRDVEAPCKILPESWYSRPGYAVVRGADRRKFPESDQGEP